MALTNFFFFCGGGINNILVPSRLPLSYLRSKPWRNIQSLVTLPNDYVTNNELLIRSYLV